MSKPKPTAWASPNVIPLRDGKDNHPCILTAFKCDANTVALYTAPPKREPLSDDEINEFVTDDITFFTCKVIVRSVEKAHGIV